MLHDLVFSNHLTRSTIVRMRLCKPPTYHSLRRKNSPASKIAQSSIKNECDTIQRNSRKRIAKHFKPTTSRLFNLTHFERRKITSKTREGIFIILLTLVLIKIRD